jgi:trimethylamine--corrinoid protein Co-methyltransferase
MGMFGTGMCISKEQLVMDNEICRIVKRFLRGIEVTQETIAMETINHVGSRSSYFTEEHTLEFLMRGEHVELDVSNGANFGIWQENGSKSATQKAKDIVSDILGKGNKCPLSQSVSDQLSDIIKKYEKLIN